MVDNNKSPLKGGKKAIARKLLNDDARDLLDAEELCQETHAITGEKSLIDPDYDLPDRYVLARELLLEIASAKNPGLKEIREIFTFETETSVEEKLTEKTPPKTAKESANYYEALGVQPGATREEIRSAYRKTIKNIHPDITASQDIAPEERAKQYEKVLQINEAYAVLSNERARSEYDDSFKREASSDKSSEASDVPAIKTATKPSSGGGLLITLDQTKDKTSPTADTQEFKNQVEAAGSLTEKDAQDIAKNIGDFAPEGFRPEQLTTALHLFAKGAKGEVLEKQTDKLKATDTISEQEAGELYRVSYFISAFEEAQQSLAKDIFASEGEPQVTLQQAPEGYSPSGNQTLLGSGQDMFAPIKQLVGVGADFAKQKVKDFAVKAINKGGKKLIQKGASLAAKAGVKAAEAAGIAIPVVGEVIAAAEIASLVKKGLLLVKRGAAKLLQTITGEKDTRKSIFALGVILTAGGLAMGSALVAGLGIFTTAASAASIVSGSAVASGMSGVVQTVVYGTTTIATTYVVPFLIAIIALPLLVALFLFIINSGAYVVPRNPSIALAENPYIGIEKVAEPEEVDNPPPNREVTYTITITARRGSLTNITFSEDCRVIGTSAGENCPSPDPSIPAPPDVITSTDPFSFTYTRTIESNIVDSVINDTFTVTADAPEAPGQTTADSASVVVGEPPIDCPLISYDNLGLRWGSYTPGDESQGHGSNAYWSSLSACSYSLPQGINCMGPTSPEASGNVCYNQSSKCAQYGYAYDVWPVNSMDVFAPEVLGQAISWDCSYAFSNGGGSAGHTYWCSGGGYLLVLTHMAENANTGTVQSGEQIGELHPMSNAHLHMEFSVGGVYERPEDYFCF